MLCMARCEEPQQAHSADSAHSAVFCFCGYAFYIFALKSGIRYYIYIYAHTHAQWTLIEY